MSSKYCQNCGAELAANAAFCSECGAEVDDEDPNTSDSTENTTADNTPTTGESTDRSDVPMWTVAALGVLWIVFLVTFPGLDNSGQASGMAALGGLSVLASIPLLYLDARAAKRAEVLEARPIFVVIAVFILYLATMPAYVGYRVYKSRKTTKSDVATS